MKAIKMLLALLLAVLFKVSAQAQTCSTPTGTPKSFTASTIGQTAAELAGDVTAGCTKSYLMPGYNCGGCQAPANGAITSFNPNTGAYVYKPNPGFIGTDSFTFMVRAIGTNTADSAQTAVTVTVTNSTTTVTARLTDLGVQAVSGKVVLVLAQVVDSPGGTLIPATRSVTATLDGTGRFTASVYPSVSLSPQAAYNLIYVNTATGRQEVIGVFNIPASTGTVDLATCGCRVTEAASQARLTLVTRAAADALSNAPRTFDVKDNGALVGSAPVLNFIPGSGMTQTIALNSGVIDVTINCATCSGGSLASSTTGRPAVYTSSTVVGGAAFTGAHRLWTSNATNNGMEFKSIACSAGITCTSTPGQLAIVGPGTTTFTLNTQTGTNQSFGIATTGATAPTWDSGGNVHTLVLPLAGTGNSWGGVSNTTQTLGGDKTFTGNISLSYPAKLLVYNNSAVVTGQWADYGFKHKAGIVGSGDFSGFDEWTWKVANTPNATFNGQTMDISEFTLDNNAIAGQLYIAKQNTLTVGAGSSRVHTQRLAGSTNYARHLSTSGGSAALLVGSYGAVHAEAGTVTDSIAFQAYGYNIASNVSRHIGFAVADYQRFGAGTLTTNIGFYSPYLNQGTNKYSFWTDQGPSGEPSALVSHGGALEFRGVTTGNAPTTAPNNYGRIYFNSSVNRFQISEHSGNYYDLTRNVNVKNCSGTCALDFASGQVQRVTFTGNISTFTVANVRSGEHYSIYWIQDATGNRSVTSLGANIKIGPGGWFAGSNTLTANAVDLLLCTAYSGTLSCLYATDVK